MQRRTSSDTDALKTTLIFGHGLSGGTIKGTNEA